MVLNKLFIYPNGIRTGYLGDNHSDSFYIDNDFETNKLFQEYIANPSVINHFEFKTRLIKNLLKLMRDCKRFFIYNILNNNFVSPPVKEYLLDTLKYIKTGSREVPVSICKHGLISAKGNDTYTFNSRKMTFVEELKNDSELDGIELLSRWVSLPNGIEDLVWFIKLLFASRL